MEKKDSRENYKNWSVSGKRQDGVRPKKKTALGKREESALIEEQTKAFLEKGGKVQVFEQDFPDQSLRHAYGHSTTNNNPGIK